MAICIKNNSYLDDGELRKSEYWDCNRDAGDDEYEPAEFTKSWDKEELDKIKTTDQRINGKIQFKSDKNRPELIDDKKRLQLPGRHIARGPVRRHELRGGANPVSVNVNESV